MKQQKTVYNEIKIWHFKHCHQSSCTVDFLFDVIHQETKHSFFLFSTLVHTRRGQLVHTEKIMNIIASSTTEKYI